MSSKVLVACVHSHAAPRHLDHTSKSHVHNSHPAVLLICFLPPPQDQLDQAEHGGPPMPLTIVFVERKNRCSEVAHALQTEGIPAAALHGGLSQVRRTDVARATLWRHLRHGFWSLVANPMHQPRSARALFGRSGWQVGNLGDHFAWAPQSKTYACRC